MARGLAPDEAEPARHIKHPSFLVWPMRAIPSRPHDPENVRQRQDRIANTHQSPSNSSRLTCKTRPCHGRREQRRSNESQDPHPVPKSGEHAEGPCASWVISCCR
jgi:hypothetical protein